MSALTDSLLEVDDGIRRVFGVVLADVTNNKDPENLGRVQLAFPWLAAGSSSGWARIATPFAGDHHGLYCLPAVGDEVLVMFERGDMNHPFVIGSLWHERARPPAENSDGKNTLRLFKSKSGHLIQLDDTDGKEQIVIREKSGKSEVVIDTASNTITLTAEKDVMLRAKGKVSMHADGDVTIRCEAFQVDAKGKVAVTTSQDLSLASANLAVDAKQAISMKAKQELSLDCMVGVKINNDGLVVT